MIVASEEGDIILLIYRTILIVLFVDLEGTLQERPATLKKYYSIINPYYDLFYWLI